MGFQPRSQWRGLNLQHCTQQRSDLHRWLTCPTNGNSNSNKRDKKMPFDQKPAPRMLPFAYPAKNFINYRTTANQIDESTTLESIRDMLRNLDAKRQPMDRVYSLKSCVVKFENHRPQLRRIVGKNQLSAPVYFSERGWQMFCDFILPSTGIRKGYRIQAQTPVADTNPLVPQQVFTRAESVATIDINWWIRIFKSSNLYKP